MREDPGQSQMFFGLLLLFWMVAHAAIEKLIGSDHMETIFRQSQEDRRNVSRRRSFISFPRIQCTRLTC